MMFNTLTLNISISRHFTRDYSLKRKRISSPKTIVTHRDALESLVKQRYEIIEKNSHFQPGTRTHQQSNSTF